MKAYHVCAGVLLTICLLAAADRVALAPVVAAGTASVWQAMALLVVDTQQACLPPERRAEYPLFETNMAALLAFCRSNGVEVGHIRQHAPAHMAELPTVFQLNPAKADMLMRFATGSPNVAPLPCARELPGERIFWKTGFTAFANPELEPYLRARGKRLLLVAGLSTDTCVQLTLFSAAQRGFVPSVIADCIAGFRDARGVFMGVMKLPSFLIVDHDRLAVHAAQFAACARQINAIPWHSAFAPVPAPSSNKVAAVTDPAL